MAKKNRKKLSFIGENIKRIRQVKKLSQADFSQLFSLARASVGAYEEGRSEPKIETLICIANHFGVSIDELLTKRLGVTEILKFNRVNETLDRAHRLDTIRVEDNPIVKLVAAAEYTEYAVRREDKNFMNSLSNVGYSCGRKPDIAFEVGNTEMSIGEVGIRHKDILFGKRTNPSQLVNKLGYIVAIVLPEELIIRRLFSYTREIMVLKADNDHFPQKEVELNQALDFFEIVGVASEYLPKPNKTEDRLAKIEAELKRLSG